jgi:hypothetical protein
MKKKDKDDCKLLYLGYQENDWMNASSLTDERTLAK